MEGKEYTKSNNYYCECLCVYISKDDLLEHLQLPLNHRILKVALPNIDFKNFSKSISKKIQSILKIQVEIQKTSLQLISLINKNTSIAVQNLEKLIRIYKNLLINPPENFDPKLKKTDIVGTFQLNKSLYSSLIEHFCQRMHVEKSTLKESVRKSEKVLIDLFEHKSAAFLCMVVSKDENFAVTGGKEGAIKVWNLVSHSQTKYLKKHKGEVLSLALGSENQVLLSGSTDCSVRLWSLPNLKHECKFTGHFGYVISVLISNDSRLGFSGSVNHTIKIWDLEKKLVKITCEIGIQIYQICFFKMERNIAIVGGGISFIDLKSKNSKEKEKIQDNFISSICFSDTEEQFITGSNDGLIQIWNANSVKKTFEIKKHTERINKIEFLSEFNFFASCSRDCTIIIWDLKNMCVVHSIKNEARIYSVCFLKTSKMLAFCTGTALIEFYQIYSKMIIKKIDGKLLELDTISISANLRYLAYGILNLVLYDLEDDKKISKFPHFRFQCSYLKFSPNGLLLGCGYSSGEVHVFIVPYLALKYKICTDKASIRCLAFSSDNKFISYGTDNLIVVSLMGKGEVVYKELGISARAAIFCLSYERFIFSDLLFNVYIMDKYFNKIAIFSFEHCPFRLMITENDENLILNSTESNWSCLSLGSMKKVFENINRKEFKYWVGLKKELKLLSIIKLNQIIIS